MTPLFTPIFHPQTFLFPFYFSAMTATSVYLHNFKINFDFLKYGSISESIKIEKIKLEYETWFRLLLTLLAGFSAIAITHYISIPRFNELVTSNVYEQNLLMVSLSMQEVFFAFVFLITICFDILKIIFKIKDNIINIEHCCKLAPLTQSISQLTLPPSQEEARAESWWRFWK